ncbi:MAG: glycosyltransferase family 4 protein [Cyanobacteriota bacterium]|jgi:glycosyltransferase involved in cell wall biosynthesis
MTRTPNRRKKFIFVAADMFVPQGSALSGLDHLRAVPTNEYQITLITRPQPAGLRNRQMPKLALSQTLRIDPNGCMAKGKGPLAWLRVQLWRLWRLRICLLLSRLHPEDVIVVNGWSSAKLWNSIRYRTAAKTAVISHESARYFSTPTCPTPREDYYNFLNSFDYVFFVSQLVGKDTINDANMRRENCFYLPNCCEEERFDAIHKTVSTETIRRNIGLPLDRPILMCPGTQTVLKGQRDIFEMAPEIEKILPGFVVIFMGDHATDVGIRLKRDIEASPWADRFRFELPGIYPGEWFFASDLLLFPTYTETLSRTVLEAMAAKLPILASAVGGIPELVEHMDSSYLFTPGDQNQILSGLRYMSENGYANAHSCAEAAYRRYRSHFTREHSSNRLRGILATLADPEHPLSPSF